MDGLPVAAGAHVCACTAPVSAAVNAKGEAPRWVDETGRQVVPHGFRSTFRVWAGEQTQHPRKVIEAALAHTMKDKVEAAYARTDLLERRRPLMEAWGTWCERPSGGAEVVPIGGSRRVVEK